jgi:hypothetical protein
MNLKSAGCGRSKYRRSARRISQLTTVAAAAQNRSSPNEARPFIDRLTEVWNFAGTDCFDAVLLLDEKG